MNFMYQIRSAAARLLYGRYGNDRLNRFLCGVILAMYVLGMLLRWVPVVGPVLHYLPTLLWLVVLLRMFSRNHDKRRRENDRFLALLMPLQKELRLLRDRSRDKEHKYFTCKNCSTVCRVPRHRGRIVITCPRCGREIHGKS